MTGQSTSDPYCNAVIERWNAATAAGDREKQLLFVSLCAKHKAPSIDWRRVAEDAGIDVPDPINEAQAFAYRDALTALVYELGRVIEHSGSTDLITAYDHARGLLNNPDRPDGWITQSEARALFERLSALTKQVDLLMAMSGATPDRTAAIPPREPYRRPRGQSLEESL